MEQDRRRPTERRQTTVLQERPRKPSERPKNARPQTGNAASREAARRERLASREQPYAAAEKEQQPERPKRQQYAQRPPRRSASRQAAPQRKRKKAKKPHRIYNTNFGFKFLIMLAVVAVIVLSMVIFFKVKHILVIPPEGNEGEKAYYTEAEIIDASGIHMDENLLSLSKAAVAARIHAALPYVRDIQIKKQLPGTVIISFSEFEVSYAIQDVSGGWWLMSRDCRILEPAEEKDAKTHLYVAGMPIEIPKVGDLIQPVATDGADMSEIAAKQKVITDLIPALEDTEYVKQLDRIDVSTSYDLTLWWNADRYEIRLGTTENLHYKLQFLDATLKNDEVQHRSGIIDLTFQEDEKVHFLEFR